MKINLEYIYPRYFNFVVFLFFAFLFGILSFGRPFSLIHIDITPVPIFITELLLLICFPLLLLRYKELLKLPRVITVPFVTFVYLGFCYLLLGILRHNLFALRDITLCAYLLFLPLTFLSFSEKKMLIFFLFVLLVSNFINLFIGMLILFNCSSIFNIRPLMEQTKCVHSGLYYGISLSFLSSLFPFISKKNLKILMILLIAMNIFMLVFFSVKTLWIAFSALFIYFVFIQRSIFVKTLMKAAPVIILIGILSFYISVGNGQLLDMKEVLVSKFKVMWIFLSKNYDDQQVSLPTHALPKMPDAKPHISKTERVGLSNIVWRTGIWKQSVKFGLRSVFLGRGFGVYPEYTATSSGFTYPLPLPQRIDIDSGVTPAHNHIVTLFFKMGLIGLTLFIFINVYAFLYGMRYIHKANDEFLKCFLIGSLGAFVFWHTAALFFDVIDSPPSSIFLWIIIGLIFAAVEIDKNSFKHKQGQVIK